MTDPTKDLGPRGKAIYKAYVQKNTDEPRKALALEAARTADRLDELDSVIQGKGVLRLMQFRVLDKEVDYDMENVSLEIEVKFQSVLTEARMQATAFTGLLKALGTEIESAPEEEKPTGADMVRKKREEREARRRAAQ